MRTIPYWLIYAVVVVLLLIGSRFIPEDTAIPMANQLTDPAKATLDFLLEMVKLITALNTALLGTTAAIIVKGRDWSTRWNWVDGLLVLVIMICASISYYGIYLGHVTILGMVFKGTIYPLATRLQWAISLQYYGTLGGVALLGLVFTRLLEGRKPPEKEPDENSIITTPAGVTRTGGQDHSRGNHPS